MGPQIPGFPTLADFHRLSTLMMSSSTWGVSDLRCAPGQCFSEKKFQHRHYRHGLEERERGSAVGVGEGGIEKKESMMSISLFILSNPLCWNVSQVRHAGVDACRWSR